MTNRDFPESPEAAHWRVVLSSVSLVFAIIATIAFALRAYASRLVSSKLRIEDVLMGIAVILMWGDTAAALMKAFNGIGVQSTLLPHYRVLRLQLGSWLVPKFWSTSMACAKISIILFLYRVMGFTRSVNFALIIVSICVLTYTGVVFFYTTFMCSPVQFYWNKNIPGGSCISNDKYMAVNIGTAVAALVTDLAILTIPMPTLWRLQMHMRQKIAITFVLGVGIIVCIFSLLRVVQFFQFDTTHLSTSSVLETLWTLLENHFSIICGCAPQMAPLIKSLAPSKSQSSSGYSASYNSPSVAGRYPKRSVIRTTVSGNKLRPKAATDTVMSTGARNSSELELNGIEVQTAIDQQVSVGQNEADDDDDMYNSRLAAILHTRYPQKQ